MKKRSLLVPLLVPLLVLGFYAFGSITQAVDPDLSVDPNVVSVGDSMSLSGVCGDESDSGTAVVNITQSSQSTQLGLVDVAGVDNSFSESFIVPEGLEDGSATVSVVCPGNVTVESLVTIDFAVATANNNEQNGDEQTAIVCPLEQRDGRIVINLLFDPFRPGDVIRADQNEEDARKGPFNTNIPPGTYAVTLVSYDDHSTKDQPEQTREEWFLNLMNNSQNITQTNAISDLPENQDYLVEQVNNNLSFNQQITSVTAFHNAFPSQIPHSVVPVCAAFDVVNGLGGAPEEPPVGGVQAGVGLAQANPVVWLAILSYLGFLSSKVRPSS